MWFWKKKKVEEEELKVEEGLEASGAEEGNGAEAEEAAEAGTEEAAKAGIDEEWGGEDAWDMGENEESSMDEEIKEASPIVDADLANSADGNGVMADMTQENAEGIDIIMSEESEGGANDLDGSEGDEAEEAKESDPDGLEEELAGSEEEKVQEKKGFFARLKEGLAKTRDNIVKGIDRLFSGSEIDDDFYEELEEILIMGDIGVNATTAIIERLKEQVKEKKLREPKECKELLIQSIREQMEVSETAYDFETKQSIIMVIGVNGVGKTTTVGKLAWKLKDDGKKVLIAAADTFRAAAGDQLAEWARRAGVPMIGGKEGADPASVVFDAVNAAKARNVDVLLIDTAGRLHNKKNLMEELRKMNRIIDKEYPDAHRENLIVLDGTTGQNALAQAREFGDVTNLTGIVLTKMDGTAKGGIAVAIQSELGIPVKYIGVGETTQDLQKFDPDEFVRALFDVDLSDDVIAEDGEE